MNQDTPPSSPYIGLIPYSEKDAAFFFGREAEQEIIAANLTVPRLTLLYGLSGVGKSSVLRAGVVHHLRQLIQENLAETGAPEFAVVVFNSWRNDPVAMLKERISESLSLLLEQNSTPVEFPHDPSDHLPEFLETWTKRIDGDLLIILDQFEEYFLYHPQEDDERTFASQFPNAVNRPNLRAHFLISIREDALAKLDRFKGRIPNLFSKYLRINHLDREAARAAIEKPVEQYNRLLARDGQPVRIEPALVEAVLEQVKTGEVILGEAGRGVVSGTSPALSAEVRIETPYLQLVMTRLWKEEMDAGSHILRLETLTRLGGAEKIVKTHLDDVMQEFSDGDRKIAAGIFHFLVTPSGTKIAHTVPDLVGYAEFTQTQITPVLERLSRPEIRVLRSAAPPPDQPAEPRYEIFHDVLAPAILDWRAREVQTQERVKAEKRIANEAAEVAKEATRQRELEQAKALAEEQRRRIEEQIKVARRLRRWRGALLLVSLIAVGIAGWAWQKKTSAEDSFVAAQETAKSANKLALLAIQETEKQSGEAAKKTLEEIVTWQDKAQTELAVAQRAVEGPLIGSPGLSPRIYIHIRNEGQRANARAIERELEKDNKFVVPGIERLDVGPVKNSEVRFFRKSEEDGAKKIVEILKNQKVSDVEAKFIPGYGDSTKIRQGHYELWFAPDALK